MPHYPLAPCLISVNDQAAEIVPGSYSLIDLCEDFLRRTRHDFDVEVLVLTALGMQGDFAEITSYHEKDVQGLYTRSRRVRPDAQRGHYRYWLFFSKTEIPDWHPHPENKILLWRDYSHSRGCDEWICTPSPGAYRGVGDGSNGWPAL